MSRKRRERMTTGVQRPARGQRLTPDVRQPSPLPARRRGSMLNKLTAAPPGEREAIRAHLRDDGSPRARALLTELERRWETS